MLSPVPLFSFWMVGTWWTGAEGKECSGFFHCETEQDCTSLLGSQAVLTVSALFFQIIQPLLELDQNRSKLKLYIGHLTALCHDRDPLILRGLTPPASYHLDDDQAAWEKELHKMTQEQVSLWAQLLKTWTCWFRCYSWATPKCGETVSEW